MSFGRREGGPPPQQADPVIERLKELAANRRDAVRMRRLKKAELIYDNGRHVTECTLRDESDSGARVRLGAWFACPEEVTLRLSDGTSFESRVVWASDLDLGLRFKAADQVEEHDDGASANLAPALGVLSALKDLSPELLVADLKTRRYLGDQDVAAASQALGDAYQALLEALRNLHQGDPGGDPNG